MTARFISARVSEALLASGLFDLSVAGGRRALEERRPFLCLHRGPAAREDLATADLQLGQAAFAIAPSATPYNAEFADAAELTLQHLAQTFKTVLLLEVIAREPPFSSRLHETDFADTIVEQLEPSAGQATHAP